MRKYTEGVISMKCKIAFILGLLLLVTVPAFASADSLPIGTSGLPWDKFLLTLKDAITGSVALAVIDMVLVSSACGLVLSDGDSPLKVVWQAALGVGLASHFAEFLYSPYVFGTYLTGSNITAAATTMYQVHIGNTASFDILSGFMNNYINNIIAPGAEYLKPISLWLLGILALMDCTWKLLMDLIKGDKVQFLIVRTVQVGMYIFLIQNWVGGTYMITSVVSQSFEMLGYKAAGGSLLNPDSIVQNSITILQKILESTWSLSGIASILMIGIIGLLVTICLFFTALNMFMVRIEFWTMALISITLLPFGVCQYTKFLSEKTIGMMFNLAIKVCVIAFAGAIIIPMVDNAATQYNALPSSDVRGSMAVLLQLFITSLISVFLTWKVPTLVQGLLSGQPTLAGGDMTRMAMAAAKGTTNVLNTAGSAAGTVKGANRLAAAGGEDARRARAFQNLAKLAAMKSPGIGAYKNAANTENMKKTLDIFDNKPPQK
jgi:type IV secretion system protein TrbL